MSEVFLSYSRKNSERIKPIAQRLGELGVEVWYDHAMIAGESFGSRIRERLRTVKAVLVCWSPEAAQSDWVDAEADYARQQGTYVPVFIESCALMPPFNRLHVEDLTEWTGEPGDPNWLKVVERVGGLLARPGLAPAAQAAASTNEAVRYEFARKYPDEPVARAIWVKAEAGLREAFQKRLAESREEAERRIEGLRKDAEADFDDISRRFEAWIKLERQGKAREARPDPRGRVFDDGVVETLRAQVVSLARALEKSQQEKDAVIAECEARIRAQMERSTHAAAQTPQQRPANGNHGQSLSAADIENGVRSLAQMVARGDISEIKSVSGKVDKGAEVSPENPEFSYAEVHGVSARDRKIKFNSVEMGGIIGIGLLILIMIIFAINS